jgi:hypothetical protein
LQPPLRIAVCATLLAVAAACASTNVTHRQSEVGDEKVARPDRILVHDFATDPADLPPGSALAPHAAAPAQPPTAEELATAKQLGHAVAKELVAEINAMGMTAALADGAPAARVGDIAIYGAFVSVDEGSGAERVIVGFGYGNASLKTFVEGFLMTERGLRRLGSGEVDSGGGKTPGVAVPLAVTLATANPIGLLVGGAAKAYGEVSGSSKVEGAGKRTAAEIAKELKVRFQQQGWIAN